MQQSNSIKLTLKIWRQSGPEATGAFESYEVGPISKDASFLEMLDVLNEELTLNHEEPVTFDHDCREGICGMCGNVVNGRAHGPENETTLCQLHMRHFNDGDTLVIEPFRAKAFKIIKDLVVDRSALDAIITEGGYISVNTGGAPDGNSIPIPKEKTEESLDSAACIGCGACVASCPNASAMLFVGAKISHLGLLPQGQLEQSERALNMVSKMDELGFGNCGNERECEAACPKGISISNIARLNRHFIKAALFSK